MPRHFPVNRCAKLPLQIAVVLTRDQVGLAVPQRDGDGPFTFTSVRAKPPRNPGSLAATGTSGSRTSPSIWSIIAGRTRNVIMRACICVSSAAEVCANQALSARRSRRCP